MSCENKDNNESDIKKLFGLLEGCFNVDKALKKDAPLGVILTLVAASAALAAIKQEFEKQEREIAALKERVTPPHGE